MSDRQLRHDSLFDEFPKIGELVDMWGTAIEQSGGISKKEFWEKSHEIFDRAEEICKTSYPDQDSKALCAKALTTAIDARRIAETVRIEDIV
jgi:hypothetical protein